jgi:hypothetical protein
MSHLSAIRNLHKLVASLMVAALFAAAFFTTTPSASAADGTVTLSGGTLTITAPENFAFTAVTLDGLSDKPTTGVFTVGVNDPTGSNAGWRVLTHSVNVAKTLPATTIASSAAVAVTDTTGATAATNSAVYPYTFSATNTLPFYNAAADTGQGSHSYAVTTSQVVPKNSLAGTYTATLTVTLSSGPA